MAVLAEQIDIVNRSAALELCGTVVEVRGLALRVIDLPVPIGSSVRLLTRREQADGTCLMGEVVGFDREQTIVMPLGATSGVRRGDRVIAEQYTQHVWVGESLLGRVLDGHGDVMDGGPAPVDLVPRPLTAEPVDPLERPLIDEPLATGVRAVDALISAGRGQRLGVFAAPGVGKSTLLGTMARHTEADVNVIALVGERGREVRDFIDNSLGEEGLKKSVVVCATSDEPALLRIRAALVASAVAEYFRDRGMNVLLIMDSLTRFCQAQREVGLAAGEPPATKGYPPSVFAMLPRLLERSGRTSRGSITGFYAVLVEGDDMNEPISDAARSVLDGHVLLSRALAEKGHWPAIDVLGSISRVSDTVIDREHNDARREVLKLVSAYRQVEDLVNIGAYAAGSNPDFDLAIACKPVIDQLVQQGRSEKVAGGFKATRGLLMAAMQKVESTRQQIARMPRKK